MRGPESRRPVDINIGQGQGGVPNKSSDFLPSPDRVEVPGDAEMVAPEPVFQEEVGDGAVVFLGESRVEVVDYIGGDVVGVERRGGGARLGKFGCGGVDGAGLDSVV